jgi:hypothetical protein
MAWTLAAPPAAGQRCIGESIVIGLRGWTSLI